jgi:hypothetical protein
MHEIMSEAAKPLTVAAWHGTSDAQPDFRPWAHFGTARAAAQRLLFRMQRANDYAWKPVPAYLIGVQLTLRRIVNITDDAGYDLDPAAMVAKMIAKRMPDDLRQAPARLRSPRQALQGLDPKQTAPTLVQHGIDGFAYRNKAEDKGSTSFVVLDPSCIRVTSAARAVSEDDLKRIYYQHQQPD